MNKLFEAESFLYIRHNLSLGEVEREGKLLVYKALGLLEYHLIRGGKLPAAGGKLLLLRIDAGREHKHVLLIFGGKDSLETLHADPPVIRPYNILCAYIVKKGINLLLGHNATHFSGQLFIVYGDIHEGAGISYWAQNIAQALAVPVIEFLRSDIFDKTYSGIVVDDVIRFLKICHHFTISFIVE